MHQVSECQTRRSVDGLPSRYFVDDVLCHEERIHHLRFEHSLHFGSKQTHFLAEQTHVRAEIQNQIKDRVVFRIGCRRRVGLSGRRQSSLNMKGLRSRRGSVKSLGGTG
jgi:hypothetical protein